MGKEINSGLSGGWGMGPDLDADRVGIKDKSSP